MNNLRPRKTRKLQKSVMRTRTSQFRRTYDWSKRLSNDVIEEEYTYLGDKYGKKKDGVIMVTLPEDRKTRKNDRIEVLERLLKRYREDWKSTKKSTDAKQRARRIELISAVKQQIARLKRQ